jgi:23S rRNA (guanosine2251-2'-O)-methyltransferase
MEWLYGRHAVLEALRAGRRAMHRVYLAPGVHRSGNAAEILAEAQRRGCPVGEATSQMLERLGPVNHQGMAAEAGGYPYVDLDRLLAGAADPAAGSSTDAQPDLAPDDPIYLVLDHLQDVQNLGTLLRTAEAMAVAGVLLPDRRAAAITPAAVNASAGAVEHLRVALVGNLPQALDVLKKAGIWVAGLDARPEAVPLARADLSGPLALVIGAEGEGLGRLVRERCDWLLAIPMYGRVESLNAAVAASVVLIAARQARAR